ncbi:MAG: hypothetical protein HGA39_05525 [Coriobacteriia bacterium]|nr:hypothetical protein [Coriobacteriia bacterium]
MSAAVPGAAGAGALALACAGMLAGGVVAACGAAAGVLALAGAVAWLLGYRYGGWLVAATGVLGIIATALAMMVNGVVPWEIVAFWGSTALLLAEAMDLTAASGSERMAMATVLAVISLLVLSAIGLGEYVSLAWPATGRQALRELPIYPTGTAAATVVSVREEPLAGGKWSCVWQVPQGSAAIEVARARGTLEQAGWHVSASSDTSLVAEKDGLELGLTGESMEVCDAGCSGCCIRVSVRQISAAIALFSQ